MKLSNYLRDIGEYVSYPPRLAMMIGDIKATIFLLNIFYWSKDPTQEIYKSIDQIYYETGLTRKSQKSARNKLIKLGLISERYNRNEHRLYYRVSIDNFNSMWDDFSQKL